MEKNMHHSWSDDAKTIISGFKSNISLKHLHKGSNEGSKNFIKCPSEFPKFDYELFVNEELQTIQGVIYFGTHIEGPPDCVHGGAIATILDAVLGTLLWDLKFYCVTVNLNINYKKFIPLNSEVRIFGEIEKTEGRKVFLKGKLTSLDAKVLHDESTAIFVKIK